MMTNKELISKLSEFEDKLIVICSNQDGAWDHIDRVELKSNEIIIYIDNIRPIDD